jgi:hypothetical protein
MIVLCPVEVNNIEILRERTKNEQSGTKLSLNDVGDDRAGRARHRQQVRLPACLMLLMQVHEMGKAPVPD